jgi:cyclophilin family peptidyl-prolyl cis-trans isomerase
MLGPLGRSHTVLGQRTKHRPTRWMGVAISAIVFSIFVTCGNPPFLDDVHNVSRKNSDRLSSTMRNESLPVTGDNVLVKCEVSTPFDIQNTSAARGTLSISVHRGLAPLASNAFLDMVTSKHFDRKYIFRVVEGFVIQWGIESTNREGGQKSKFPKVDIDPPPSTQTDIALRSNVRGSLNFAGGNSASGQVYINRGTNSHLDREPGSLPFASLDEYSMSIIDSIYAYKEGLGQVVAVKKGDAEVKRQFPRMSRIEKCWIEKS